MKPTHNLLSTLNALQQSKWIRPALMMSALIASVFGVAGCHTNH